ncbi:amino acid ABC transporter permease [Paludibacterium yongneupense]|uniref:amino acid ABC transporter permease n=1 Tax=Paludibacterium yongneupense TaxID=400061 RepID=UPI00040F3302|nr:amino acid ABC transporter permease [Paludibacterium yongneupense]
MAYQFDFSGIWEYRAELAAGVVHTLALTGVGTVFGLLVGVVGGAVRGWRVEPYNRLCGLYVELIRNTPFLVQLFFIFFGLPALGVHLNEWVAAALAMIINLGAYTTEIVRAGVQATPRGQMEAGLSLAMSRRQVFWHVVLPPALGRVWPALCSQIVIVMLGSSVCSQISAEELTFAASYIQSRNFRAFETYIVTAVLYLLLAIVLRHLLNRLGARLTNRDVAKP